MRLDIPFYPNTGDGNQCMQVAMNSVFKHYLNTDFSLEELDRRTHRGPKQWTTTFQIIPMLWEEGLHVRYYTREDPRPILAGESFYRSYFGSQADEILSHLNVETVVSSIQELLKYDLVEVRVLSLEELENHVKQGHVPLVTLDWNVVTGKGGSYRGHFVPIVGFDENNFFVHDSGPINPTPFLPISKSTFKRAWDALGADNDAIIVYGKK